ncbi:XdhC family protein [Acidaminobacter hydrogenoformans]|uniref:Xanthine and CO dehydrogenase maturation factor, XdhC/CoxF family n=1 Tax=Acidaminobacter hydrogenoformans DSM 2784 TaxID=1120920 RepID=A0A1G5S3J5_9FIRM|nr:XdhC/CoxI family protein [Acidaminobacter hydrogenoformans]SCZ80982.1 Xanthine and CO dehydrogenase maturation factor, XdhC/CoxF family [Acidaminobacter hydrogenoformans DSM 2784]
MLNLYERASELVKANVPFALATIVESKGSTPRHSGKMIVLEEGEIIGTIGGGLAEKTVIDRAVEAIKLGKSEMVEMILNSDAEDGLPMHCGGGLKVFVEVHVTRPTLVLAGGGHVNMSLYKFALALGYDVIIVEDREAFGNPVRFPEAREIHVHEDMEKAMGLVHVHPDMYIVIATKDSDEKALRAVVNSDAAYIGLIGSRRKVGIILEHLKEEGVDASVLERVHAPIGLDIGAETPPEIAVSILAEVLKVMKEATGRSMKELRFK